MTHRIFIDGQAGTTGLDIHARLAGRPDLTLLEIDPQRRKDTSARQELLNAAEIVILCLPDEAAREAVALIREPGVRVLDASSTHRTAPGWVYGLPELTPDQRISIASANRVANPGCYPTGFLLLLRPLIDAGLLHTDAPFTVHALSGYTGGGNRLVEYYEQQAQGEQRMATRSYGLSLTHKHLPEMLHWSGLTGPPLFTPLVGPFARGMLVQVPITCTQRTRSVTPAELTALLAERYANESCVRVYPAGAAEALLEDGFLDPMACNGTNRVDLMVFGHNDQQLLVARLDNLGKGAGGAAMQNLNLMLGIDAPVHRDPVRGNSTPLPTHPII